MIVQSTVILDDGRAFELSLEPVFDDRGYKVRTFKIHAIEEVSGRQLKLGGEVGEAEKAFALVS